MLGDKEEDVGLQETIPGEKVARDFSSRIVVTCTCLQLNENKAEAEQVGRTQRRMKCPKAEVPGASPGATANCGTPL